MPAIVQLNLSQALISADGVNPGRWVELSISARTIAAFENLLRSKELGGRLKSGGLQFLRDGGVVVDTGCQIGDLIKVVADSSEATATTAAARAAQAAAGQQAPASKQAGNSSYDQHGGAATKESGAASSEVATTGSAQAQLKLVQT